MDVCDFARLYIWVVFLACAVLPSALGQNCAGSKSVSVSLKTRSVSVQEIGNAVLFHAGMEVDVDGAPNAYGSRNTGLDYTANAKDGSAWAGVVTDSSGNPLTQKGGPYDGYYVSTTSLSAAGGTLSDPSTYVDATKTPYIALPPAFVKEFGIVLGDLAVVVNEANGRSAYAIYADVGPRTKIGEGSVALASALGFQNTSPRNGGVSEGIGFLVFPKSGLGQGKLRTLDEINNSASQLYAKWGGAERLQACSQQNDSSGNPSPPKGLSNMQLVNWCYDWGKACQKACERYAPNNLRTVSCQGECGIKANRCADTK